MNAVSLLLSGGGDLIDQVAAANQRLKPIGAAILVFRASMSSQADPAAQPNLG
jgi:hypothetical protein